MRYYIDTCIYINYWRHETSRKVAFWRVARRFFQYCWEDGHCLIVSPIVLKELQGVLGHRTFQDKITIFHNDVFDHVSLAPRDYALARAIRHQSGCAISFGDCLHIVLAKKSASMLITRDRKLLHVAAWHGCVARTPEQAMR